VKCATAIAKENSIHKPSGRNSSVLRGILTVAAAAAIFALTLFNNASAYTLKTLHSFCTENNCGDGLQPWAGLLMDQAGNIYGTTAIGGKYYEGVVFKLIPNAKKTKYPEYILKNFCAKPNCPGGKIHWLASSWTWTVISTARQEVEESLVVAHWTR